MGGLQDKLPQMLRGQGPGDKAEADNAKLSNMISNRSDRGAVPPPLARGQIPVPAKKPDIPKKNLSSTNPVSLTEARRQGKVFYGKDAIKQVEAQEGKLTAAQRRVVELEGFVSIPYLDDRGVATVGVGQTKEFMNKGFKASFKEHENRAKRAIPGYVKEPEYLQAELIQATYRGDVSSKYKWVKHLNKGDYEAAAKELLNNEDYKTRKVKKDDSVVKRLEALHNALIKRS